MADPLSISASIAGVVTLADIVYLRSMRYIRSVKNADKEIQDLAAEINLLGGALNSLSRLARGLENADEPFCNTFRMYHVQSCNEILLGMRKKLVRDESKPVSTKQKLLWPFTSSRVKDLLADISRHKESINLALTANSMDALLKYLAREEDRQKDQYELVAQLRRTQEITVRIQQDNHRLTVLHFFLKHNPQKNYEMSRSLRHPRTGLWLLGLSEFQSWLAMPDSQLWLRGIPGAGKTVLAASIIEEVLSKQSETCATAFFFCDYKEEKAQKPVNILGAIAFQLAVQKEAAYKTLETYYNELHPERGLPSDPTVQGLYATLCDTMSLFDKVFLVVDGLDECGVETGNVVQALRNISDGSENVSLALLSRDESQIRDILEEDFVSIEIAAHEGDIIEFVTAEIEERIRSKRLRLDDLNLKDDLVLGLVKGAKGMFRWVACQLDSLEACVSDDDCRLALTSLPPDLDKTYARILDRVPPKQLTLVQTALNLIAYAEPKLSLRQLREVVSIQPDDRTATATSHPIREDAITRLCGSFIRRSRNGKFLEFAHFSAQEYLASDSLSTEHQSFRISQSSCNQILALRCLQFLQLQTFDHYPEAADVEINRMRRRNEEHPLYSYSAVNWPRLARRFFTDQGIRELAFSLFNPKKTGAFTSWAAELHRHYYLQSGFATVSAIPVVVPVEASHEDRMLATIGQVTDKDFYPLHLAALLALPEVCMFLLDRKASVDLQGPFGTPIQCAVGGPVLLVGLEQPSYSLMHWNEVVIQSGGDDKRAQDVVNTVKILHSAGAHLSGPCSGALSGLTLVEAALACIRACFPTGGPLRVFTTLLTLGASLEERDVQAFEETLNRLYSDSVQALVECLNDMVDSSPRHFELCSLAWNHAISSSHQFAADPMVVDTRISLSEESLRSQAIMAVETWNLATLKLISRDSRIQLAKIVNSAGRPLMESALLAEFCRSESVEIVQTLINAGCSLNGKGQCPGWHPALAWTWTSWTNADDVTERRLVETLIAEGASSNMKPPHGENFLHRNILRPNRLKLFLEIDSAENISDALTAMATVGGHEYTPVTYALAKGSWESALLLLERGPQHLQRKDIEKCLLHYLSPYMSLNLIDRLLALHEGASVVRFQGMLPLDRFVKASLCGNDPRLNTKVAEALLAPKLLESEEEGSLIWEVFVNTTIPAVARAARSDSWPMGRQDGVSEAVEFLIRLGIVKLYEDHHQRCALLPILELELNAFGWQRMEELHPLSVAAICSLLRCTGHWSSLRETPTIIRLLTAAIASLEDGVVQLLLDNGVAVQPRVSNLSPLEEACAARQHRWPGSEPSNVFAFVLDRAGIADMNSLNQGTGLGLLHLANTPDKVEALLARGADPNTVSSTTGVSALLHHIQCGREESVKTLLVHGADPTILCSEGKDAVFEAVSRDLSDVLQIMFNTRSPHWTIDWQRIYSPTYPASITGLQPKGVNLLHQAAASESLLSLRFLMGNHLSKGLESRAEGGYSAIHFAAMAGHTATIYWLISQGAQVNARSDNGELALHLAAKCGNHSVAVQLLSFKSETTEDSHGMTPSQYAEQEGHASILALFEENVDGGQEAQDTELWEAQSMACNEPSTPRTDKTSPMFAGDIVRRRLIGRAGDTDGDTPQYWSSTVQEALRERRYEIAENRIRKALPASRMHLGVVEELLAHLVVSPRLNEILSDLIDRFVQDDGDLLPTLTDLAVAAIRSANTDGLRVLLSHARQQGGSMPSDTGRISRALNSPARSEPKYYPLHAAAECGSVPTIDMLWSHGADIDISDRDLRTPLHSAVLSSPPNCLEVARALVRRGAVVHRRDSLGDTPLMLAAERGLSSVVGYLLSRGADPAACNYQGQTALHVSCAGPPSSSVKVFRRLLRAGEDPNVEDTYGLSAVHLALSLDHFASFLLGGGDLDLGSAPPFPWKAALLWPLTGRVPWLTGKFRLYLKKLGPVELARLSNLEPAGTWSPLCIAASLGMVGAMENLLLLGARLELEGCPAGTALMAACEAGRFESVRFLVRSGAAVCYHADGGGGGRRRGRRSAVDAAGPFKDLVRWLVAGRFSDQRLLCYGVSTWGAEKADGRDGARIWAGEPMPRAGILKHEAYLGSRLWRESFESSLDYLRRLERMRKDMMGLVAPRGPKPEDLLSSRLIPEEKVQIHPTGYSLPAPSMGSPTGEVHDPHP